MTALSEYRSRPLTLALLALLLLAMVRIAWVCDDAFITFRTVDNFVHGYGLTWNVDERVQTYTHALWMFVMSLAYAFTGEAFYTAIVVSLGISLAALYVVLGRLAPEMPRALAFTALFLVSTALMDYTSSGLENPLSYLLVALFVRQWQAGVEERHSILKLFLIGALAVLNRQDLVLLLAPTLALQLWQRRSKRAVLAALLGLSPLIAWEIFSLIYYGFLFPNTYYAKLETGISRAEYWTQGLIYLEDTLVHDPATVVIVLLGAVLGWSRRSWPLALGIVSYVIYVVSVGGDFMQGRFLSVPAFLALILLVQHRGEENAAAAWPWAAGLAFVGVFALRLGNTYWDAGLAPQDIAIWRPNGIADERRAWVSAGSGLARAQRDRRMPYDELWTDRVLQSVDADQGVVQLASSIGFAGFVLGPKAHVIDGPALADPLLARLPIDTSPPWRVGHFLRHLPPGYIETLRSGKNQIADPGLAQLYEKISLVTRGPIWSWERWRAIAFLNSGGYRQLLDGYLAPQNVGLEKLSLPRPEHYPWNGEGNVTMGDNGVLIDLGSPRHAQAWSISLDSNDDYRCQFRAGADVLGEVLLSHRFIGDGLHTQMLTVPSGVAQRGYDHILVKPLRGDGAYSIGHLRELAR